MADPSLTYGAYLRVEELLSLQTPRSEEHDEHLFIVVHQVYELWFRQVLVELDEVAGRLDADRVVPAGHGLVRVLKILKTMVAQLDVLETMTPLEFLSFRDRLAESSGFQSAQFRELEVVLGLADAGVLDRFPAGSPEHERLVRRLAGPRLWTALLVLLGREGFAVDGGSDVDVEDVLVEVYRRRPDLAELCERFVDLDEGLQEWRYRHVKMVERTIGTKAGTGGSPGSAYLRSTLHREAFPRLWAIRARL